MCICFIYIKEKNNGDKMERWFLNRDGNWIIEGLRGNLGEFDKKPTRKQMKNLFKNRKRGTAYYEIWKRTGKEKYFYNSRLGISEYRREYKLITRAEIPLSAL